MALVTVELKLNHEFSFENNPMAIPDLLHRSLDLVFFSDSVQFSWCAFGNSVYT